MRIRHLLVLVSGGGLTAPYRPVLLSRKRTNSGITGTIGALLLLPCWPQCIGATQSSHVSESHGGCGTGSTWMCMCVRNLVIICCYRMLHYLSLRLPLQFVAATLSIVVQ